MARFRKKPVVIEAVQWTGKNFGELAVFMADGERSFVPPDGTIEIHTLEGTMRATPGDWIIRGVKGELYPCKPDIFEATYEPEDMGALELGAAVRAAGLAGR